MANVFLLTTIAIVVSPSVNCERRAFLPNANNFLKAVPNHWKHDKEELNKNLVKNAGQPWEEMRVGPRPPPLHSNPPAQWILAQQNQLPDKGQTLRRIEQLQNKLNNQPRNNIIQTLNQPHPKPEIEVKLHKNKKQKREAKLLQNGFRHKREVVINPQMQPELIMQSHIQPALLQKIDDAKNVGHSRNFLFYNPNIYYPDIIGSLNNKSDQEQEKDAEKRDKRQILLMIKQQPLNLGKKPRTTPNPFIRDTNIADYEIGKVDIDKPEINVVDTMDTDSYQLSPIQKVLSEFTKMLWNLKKWFHSKEDPLLQLKNNGRVKRSPKMSKLYKKQKLEKKKRKKKKQQKLTPRQIKHYRRIREHKEKRRRILHKKLKEKRRLRHKKLGTGPYNKSIIDYYGVYFDSSSSQLNDSLYDSIYDTDAIDTEEIYQEHLKNYPDYSGEKENEDEEDEEYTLEDSSEEEDNNSTINYEDPTSAPLNDSLFNSIYDTEAIDSDKMYEEQMKNYPESEEEEESEEESEEEEDSEDKKGSSDISKGDDDKGLKKNQKASKEITNKENKNNKLKNQNHTPNSLQMKRTNIRNTIKSGATKDLLPKSNDKIQKSHSVQVVNQVNKQKSASKLSRVKQTENKIFKTKLNNEHFKNKDPPIHKRVEQNEGSKTKYNSKSQLIDTIFDNKPEPVNYNSNLGLSYQDSTNYLITLKKDPYIPASHYRDIIPIIMRDYASVHRRMPI